MDRLTIAWFGAVHNAGLPNSAHTYASRSFDRGAHWSQPTDFGPSNYVHLALDSSDNVIASTQGGGAIGNMSGPGCPGISLRAVSPTGTTWSAPVQTTLQTVGCHPEGDNSRLMAHGNHVHVVAPVGASVPFTLQTVTCDL
jgi:hypothetical protein